MTRWLLALTVAAATLVGLPSPAHAATYTPSSNPILFVHGWNSSASTWNTMISRFATNTQTACVVHTSLQNDATIYGQVRDFINP